MCGLGRGGEEAWIGVLNRPPPTPVPPTAPTPTTYGMTYLAYRVTGALCLAAQTLGSGKTFLTVDTRYVGSHIDE